MSSREKNLVIVRSALDQGLTAAQAAARFGVSRQWVHALVRRYEADGPDGLAPRSRAPKSRPGTTSTAVRERVVQLRHQLTSSGADAGPETIAWHLRREGMRAPSTSTIRRILHAHGLVVPEPKKRPKSSYVRFEADLPNGCWQADITHWHLSDGTRVEVLDFLDDHSRYLLHLRASAAYSGPMVVAALQGLIDTHGLPASTLTDNGLVFTARLAGRKGGRNGFEKLLQTHHIQQKNGHPGHPQTQGKIERFHQTLKKWLRARARPASIADLQALLDEFAHWYNHQRPHRSLSRRTPHEAYTALPKATPNTPASEPQWRTRTDKIGDTGTVTLRYAGKLRHLGIGRAHAGQPVLMLIHDDHVITSHAETGEVLTEHRIDPNSDYQRPQRRPS